MAKISTVLEWLENSNDVEDDELVVMMDAYGWCYWSEDVWYMWTS